MTRHNLDEHLSWLLSTKATIPPATNGLPPVLSSTSIETSPPSPDGPEGAQTSHLQQGRSELQESVRPQAADMARLRTEPGSASKPNLIAASPRVPNGPSPDNRRNSEANQQIAPSYPTAKASLAQTPSRQYQGIPPAPHDVEIMDLTENMDQMRSPTGTRGRKRKSSEFESDMGGPSRPLNASTSPCVRPNQPIPLVSQQSFTAIDEIMDEPLEPPPPYSTIPPRQFANRRTLPRGINAQSTEPNSTLAAASPHGVSDSEDDDDMIVDFTGSVSKQCNSTFSAKKTALTGQRSLAGSNDSPSRLKVPTGPKYTPTDHQKLHGRFQAPFGPLTGSQKSIPAPTPPTVQEIDCTGSEILLKRFFALSDVQVNELTERLKEGRDGLVEAVFKLMDADEDDTELQSDLKVSTDRFNALTMLSSKREGYQRLSNEKELLSAALKHAIRTQQGLDDAKAANSACKARMQQVETECRGLLEICQKDIENYIGFMDQSEHDEAPKAIAVHSTQATTLPQKDSGPAIPSSSRIAQTQMGKSKMLPPKQAAVQQPVSKEEASPTNIEAYFSPPRKQAGNRTTTGKQQPHSKSNLQNDLFNGPFQGLEDEDMFARGANLFSNRMGTPPTPMAHEDEEDFGMGDDEDMLELAEDIENYGVPRHNSYQNPSRPVFSEVPGNSQRKASSASAKKAKRNLSKPPDKNMEDLFRFPWSNDVKSTLKERFRLRGFRENQLQAINATLGGKDTFVLMPTGGGKSLCYQLPSLITCGKTLGVTVVVSPLLSLMEDQVQHLRRLHIQAFLINGETKAQEKNAVFEALNEEEVEQFVQLLYITPEMLNKSSKLIHNFEQLYRRQRLARLVIDEAHCVSQWGHDFRPDYKQIGDVRRRFPNVPVMALTATATENVKVDTIHNLSIDGCEVYTQSFNRPNLYYEVREKAKGKEDIQNIANLIKEKHPKQTGIIYCFSKQNCEDIAKALRDQHNIKARHYHAGIKPEEKSEVQKQWQAGKCHVIAATIAFGMGIDKPDVRFVIHHTIPKSLEGYYQETGRAGRDQKQSSCYLFYGYKDAGKIRRMIDDGEGSWEQKERQRLMLRNMVQYCENRSDCRRVQVLRYFSEAFHRDDCDGQCDNCNSTSTFETVDFTPYAQQAINLVRQVASDKVTVQHCIDIFCESKAKKVTEKGHDVLEEYGAGKDLDRGDVERLFSRLLSEEAIREANVVNKMGFANQYVELGRKCGEFKPGKTKLEMQIKTSPRGKPKLAAKKRVKKDPAKEQTRNWKKTAGNSIVAPELPLSTNVSSPIQAASTRKQARNPVRGQVHGNGYYRDDFVVSDPEDGNYAEGYDDDSSDAFGPIRVAGQPRPERARTVGPPIQFDRVMEDLDEIHRNVVESFVETARKMARQISINKNLSTVPFTDTMLRNMAIDFTETEDQMLAIPGINPERVRLYGKPFCKLVREHRQSYEEMMADRPDPNARNVIDLVSDEEDDYGSIGTSDLEDEDDEGESSAYFHPTKEVEAFNARFALSQSAALREAATSPHTGKAQPKGKKRNYRATASAGTATRRRFTGGSRYASNSYNGYGQPSGISKKKAGGKRPSGGGNRAGNSTGGIRDADSRSGGRGRGGGGGAISMMPT